MSTQVEGASPSLVRLEIGAVDLDRQVVHAASGERRLTEMEARLFAWLIERPRRLVAPSVLLREVWGYSPQVKSRTVYSTVRRLREKIELDPEHPRHLVTVPRRGYEFHPLEATTPTAAAPTSRSVVDRPEPAPARRTNLGPDVDVFVGRRAELAQLDGLLREHGARLVTVRGMGGAGKTRLCRRYGLEHLDHFEGGVWFCDLGEARTEAACLQEAARVLGVPAAAAREAGSLAERLGRAIASRGRLLIVLDNIEQLVEPLAALVARWRDLAPEASFLATGRVPLGLRGEHVLPLPPLALPEPGAQDVGAAESVQLFEARARELRPDLALSADDLQHVAGIVRQLDGLPLAIELAAGRIELMSPAEILQHFDHRLDLLRSRRRDVAPRHLSLRAALDSSWELLTGWQQAALRRCAVFAGPFTLEAAEAVIDLSPWPDAPWVVDVLDGLAAASLLFVRHDDSESRIDQFGVVREWGLERLREAGEAEVEAAERRHAAHYASFGGVDALVATVTSKDPGAQRRLAADLPNLVAAVERSLARDDVTVAARACQAAVRVLMAQGPLEAAVELTGRLLGRDDLDPLLRGDLQIGWGDARRLVEPGDEVLEAYRSALAIAREHGDPRLEGSARYALALDCIAHSRMAEAREHVEASVVAFDTVGYRYAEAGSRGLLGSIALRAGHLDEAGGQYRLAVDLFARQGARHGEGVFLSNLAVVEQRRGDFEAARQHAEQALAIHRETGARRFETMALTNLGFFQLLGGALTAARACFDEALLLARRSGAVNGEALALLNLGETSLAEGDPDGAEAPLQAAAALCDRHSLEQTGCYVRRARAAVCSARGELDEARRLLQEGEAAARAGGFLDVLALTLCRRVEVELRAGARSAAEEALGEATRLSDEVQATPRSQLGRELAAAKESFTGGSQPGL